MPDMTNEEFIEYCYQKALVRNERLADDEGQRMWRIYMSLPNETRLWEKAGAACYRYTLQDPQHDPSHFYSETPRLYRRERQMLREKGIVKG